MLKKQMLILNKYVLHIVLCLFISISWGQSPIEKKWKQEQRQLEYRKGDKYNGPENWYGPSPAGIKEEQINFGPSTPGGNTIKYVPKQIRQDRQKRYEGFDRGGGTGDAKFEPRVKRPDPIEIDPIDIDPPDINLPDLDTPSISPTFWKILLFLMIFAAVITLLYVYLKNRKPADKKVVVDVEDDWNPEIVTKTELELRLEKAVEAEDYRECVRIYFTFILKELIGKGWLNWQKDKTNYQYSLELRGKPNSFKFDETVRIYDIVWYGEYEIDKDDYELVQPVMNEYYQELKQGAK